MSGDGNAEGESLGTIGSRPRLRLCRHKMRAWALGDSVRARLVGRRRPVYRTIDSARYAGPIGRAHACGPHGAPAERENHGIPSRTPSLSAFRRTRARGRQFPIGRAFSAGRARGSRGYCSGGPLSCPPPKKNWHLGNRSCIRLGMKRKFDGLLAECCGCREMLPRGQFRKRVRGGRVVLRPRCRACEKPERAAAAATRRKRVRGTYTAADVRRLYLVQNGRCRRCLRSLALFGYHVDHVVPIAKGGLNVAGNLQLLCPRCNLRKGAR